MTKIPYDTYEEMVVDWKKFVDEGKKVTMHCGKEYWLEVEE